MTDHIASIAEAPASVQNDPVTVSVSRRVKPGREAEFEDWLHGIAEVAKTFEGQQGLSVLRPSDKTGGTYVIIYRFDDAEHAAAWESSAVRAEWIARLDGISDEVLDRSRATGLEVWFDLPRDQAVAPSQPPRHVMAVVLITVIFALVFGLQALLGPYIAHWPRWSQVLIIVVLQVLSLTYLIMPIIAALLQRLLRRKAA